MNWVFLVASLALSSIFSSSIDKALTLAQNHDWNGAAAALDQAAADDPAAFGLNNFSYLRGRIAEQQEDWLRAQSQFMKIAADNVLRPLAAWHAATAALHLKNTAIAEQLLAELPSDFPADLKMQTARLAPSELASQIYAGLSTREARFERARLLGDTSVIWSLLRERDDDDVGLACAKFLDNMVSDAKDMMAVAGAYVAHRQFDRAFPLYQKAASDPLMAADSRFQLARIQFLQENYRAALDSYRAVSRDFPDSERQKDADYQIATCYWRLGDFPNAEKAFLAYISRYGSLSVEEGAIRNLVDVYRVTGQNQKALLWIDRALAKRLSVANRQVFLFTKAKILYAQKRYGPAAQLFHQLAHTRIRPAAGNTTKEEALYFEALSLSRTGNNARAKAIWRDLSSEPFTYYGEKASEKLGHPGIAEVASVCSSKDRVLNEATSELATLRRPLRTEPGDPAAGADVVSELIFLQLWDEASLWNDRRVARDKYLEAAQLAYAAGRYNRSINYADRLTRSGADVIGLQYPTGFRALICTEARKYNIDPLWLHAIIWQESKYNPTARSGASARGLMQFIPETANKVGAAIGMPEFPLDRLYDPEVSIRMGAYYWSSLLTELKDPVMALAAYNGGIDNVRRWKSKWPSGGEEFFIADIGFLETKRYVMAVYGARAAYGSLK